MVPPTSGRAAPDGRSVQSPTVVSMHAQSPLSRAGPGGIAPVRPSRFRLGDKHAIQEAVAIDATARSGQHKSDSLAHVRMADLRRGTPDRIGTHALERHMPFTDHLIDKPPYPRLRP